jgi:hypothetical protein
VLQAFSTRVKARRFNKGCLAQSFLNTSAALASAGPIPTPFGTTGFRFMVGHARDAANPSALLGQNYADPAWNRFTHEMPEDKTKGLRFPESLCHSE